MDSGIRVILQNPIYTGLIRWNTSKFVKDPVTSRRVRRARPQTEWIEYRNEELRIVNDEMFAGAQVPRRTRGAADSRAATGRRPKYLLSGLLKRSVCNANYVMADARSYACASHWSGGACSNSTRVRRDHIQTQLLTPIRDELLSPASVDAMAKELRERFQAYQRSLASRADLMPRQIQEQEARLQRLRGRLSSGDPDMTLDEIQAAIVVAEGKLEAMRQAQPAARESARQLMAIPRAAAEIVTEIDAALAGNERSVMRTRATLRRLFNGRIDLTPGEEGSLWADYQLTPAAVLVKASGGAGKCGSGGVIWTRDMPLIRCAA